MLIAKILVLHFFVSLARIQWEAIHVVVHAFYGARNLVAVSHAQLVVIYGGHIEVVVRTAGSKVALG